MAKIRVTQFIPRPIEEVFDLVSDHEKFLNSVEGVRAQVIKEGLPNRNGLGCKREVRAGTRVFYVEEVTKWTRPTSFEYTIRKASMPIRHYGSRMEFTSRPEGTEIIWTSRFDIAVPILGWAFAAYMRRQLEIVFIAMLKEANIRLTG